VKVEAIFQNGVFKPVSPPELREGERVHLTVERVVQGDIVEIEAVARGAALSRLRAGIDSMNFCSSGPLPSRDELHERS
jgi:predicted DNA-binding antitoxin AbrB/MazE fold protein